MQPLVSVICLCYNHAQFLTEALDSVLSQTYRPLEIMVVDDASTDNSAALLQNYVAQHPELKLILNKENQGNCRAFNQALTLATGEFIIDFATDDVLLPTRIAEQVNAFERLDNSYGVVYTNAELIDEKSSSLGNFYKCDRKGNLTPTVATGNIYAAVLQRFFICSPTLMIRKDVFTKLNGYDESLAYEDFDLIVRAARDYQFYYLDKVLTQRRLHANQLSKGWYKVGDKQLLSTIKVCRKALALNRTETENKALITRVEWEIKQAFFTKNYDEAEQLFRILKELRPLTGLYWFMQLLVKARVDLSFIHRVYYKLVHKR